MSTIVTGIVTNGLIVPASPLPEGIRVEIHVPEVAPEPPPVERLTATQLRKLPLEQRRAILAASAALAEEIYRTDKDLTGFDAFSEELDDDTDEG